MAAGATLLAACNDGDEVFAPDGGDRFDGGVVGISSSAPTLLRSPQSCDDLVAGLRDIADETMIAGIVDDRMVEFDATEAAEADVAAAPAPTNTGAADDDGSSSDTNTQEAGIDEPDTVENDGEFVYTFASSGDSEQLVILDGASAEVVSRLDLGTWGNTMLLSGDRLLVISGGGYAYGPMPMPEPMPVDVGQTDPVPPDAVEPNRGAEETGDPGAGPDPAEPPIGVDPVEPVEPVEPVDPVEPPDFYAGTTISLIDVSDRAEPEVVEVTEVEGSHNTTRVVDGVARVVISSYPDIQPLDYDADYEDSMADAIDNAGIEEWLPSYRTITNDDGQSTVSAEGEVVPCEQVLVPDVNAGSGETSILRVDFTDGFDPADTTTVVADAGTVYASSGALYIAATQWDMIGSGGDWSTAVHAFDLTGDGAATHLAVGEVPGSVLNQYSMSEYEGDLRIATTEGGSDESQSGVRVLRRNGESLDEVGAVTGLGLTETIQSVRFMGDTAYVVTFRQTDPLYVIDLSDPTNPEAVGELKIPGFSSYLHPIGNDLLVGVGRNADEEGRDTGFLVSVFDVSDPANPTQLDTFTDPGMHSPAGFDAKAFLWWEAEGVVVLPFESYQVGIVEDSDDVVSSDGSVSTPASPPSGPTAGLLVLDVGAGGIDERGRVSGQSAGYTYWSRSLVVQDALWGLYTASSSASNESGVAVADFDDLAGANFHPFG